MSQTAQTTINGQAYKLVKLPPLQAGRLATRVAQALAGALSDADLIAPLMEAFKGKADGTVSSDDDGAVKAASPGMAISGMLSDAPKMLAAMAGGIRKLDADVLYEAALGCVTGNLFADTKLPDVASMNAHFSERAADLLPVLVWALRENCSGFFGIGAKA